MPCPNCAACGAVGRQLYADLKDGLFTAPGVWSLVVCANDSCGLIWLDPMPLPEDLHLAYQEYYTHGDELAGPRAKRLAKCAYRLVVDAFLSMVGIPQERKRAQLMFIDDSRPLTLLDIGCGQGDFLAKMAKRGWSVAGVDFDPIAVQAARDRYGLDVCVGTVDSIIERGRKFDVVTISHVIEHVPEPVVFLSQCRRLLQPGGRVILKTPNVDSFGHRKYGRAWRGLEPPRHLHLFTVRALHACARQAGFVRTHCFTTSVGAEVIWTASHFLQRKSEFRFAALTTSEFVQSKFLAPLFALQGKFRWWLDRASGEEICAVLKNDSSV